MHRNRRGLFHLFLLLACLRGRDVCTEGPGGPLCSLHRLFTTTTTTRTVINVQTDLQPCHQWNLSRWHLPQLFHLVQHGTPEQIEHVLAWSYSGCSAELSEQLYAAAGQAYPYA